MLPEQELGIVLGIWVLVQVWQHRREIPHWFDKEEHDDD